MQIRKYSLRFSLIFFIFIACLCAFCIRLILIQVYHASNLAALSQKQHNYFLEIEPIRGSIYDRNMKLLAFNIPAYSLFANPKSMSDGDKVLALKSLSDMLNLNPLLMEKNFKKNKYFVWLKRKLSVEMKDKINKLNIHGLGFKKESLRYYPNGSLTSHIIGFAGVDNKGLEGLELFYDKELRGRSGQTRILRDAKQTELMLEDSFFPQIDGFNLILTIDETIQYIVERELDKAYKKNNAKSASIIVMDIKTGEILALANRPTYDLDKVSASRLENRINRAISYVYEPGSVFKIVTASAALEEGEFTEDDIIFCENGEYRVANNILHDHHPHGKLSFSEVFKFSSNIGVTKIAQKLGPKIIYDYAKRFRFGIKTGIDLKGEVNGIMRSPLNWSKTSIGAIPIGHEVTTTPLQLVSAISAIANEGIYMRPFVVKYIQDSRDQIIRSFEPQVMGRVISPVTAHRVKEILKGVVKDGTGQRAGIKGVKVAGKTGTAQKVINGKYSHKKYFSTFIGFAPADAPRVAAIVVFDEPGPKYFGGTVAAPVFKEIVENTLKYLETSD